MIFEQYQSIIESGYLSFFLAKSHRCVALVQDGGAQALPALHHQPPGQQGGVGHDEDGEHQEKEVDEDVEVQTELHGGGHNV